MIRDEMIGLLVKARNLLHQEEGNTVSSLSITLAHDYVDMAIDALVDQGYQLRGMLLEMQEADWISNQLNKTKNEKASNLQ